MTAAHLADESRAVDFRRLPRVKTPRVDFAVLERGKGPLVLCLHGFPDNACTWLPLLDQLAAEGYRAVAPFMPGYYPTSQVEDGDYSVVAMAQDVLALIAALGEQSAIVIGHDWGGFVAYTAANLSPQSISKLVVAGAPHMHNTPFTLAQLLRSWYVLFFQLPLLPQRVVARRDFRFIDMLYRHWSPEWTVSTAHLDSVKASLSAPGALLAALSYYRCMLRGMNAARWKVMSQKTSVPSLVFVGEVDGSTGPELFAMSEDCYENLHSKVSMPGVGHFAHLENPEDFWLSTKAFLRA